VQVAGVQTRAVDHVVRHTAFHRGHVAGSDHTHNRIGHRFGGEAPDVPFVDAVVWGGVDFIDTPVVGLSNLQQSGRGIGRIALGLADEHSHRVGPIRRFDVGLDRSEIHVVRSGVLAGDPGERHIAAYVHCAVFRLRLGRRRLLPQAAVHHILDFLQRQRPAIDRHLVEQAAKRLGPFRHRVAVVADPEEVVDRTQPGIASGRRLFTVDVHDVAAVVPRQRDVIPPLRLQDLDVAADRVGATQPEVQFGVAAVHVQLDAAVV